MEHPLLEDLPQSSRRELVSTGRRRNFARGEVVFHRDDPADTLHLVRRGRFAVQITTPLGDTAILSLVGPGESFGEVALVSAEDSRSATVFALEASETLSLHRAEFARLRRDHPTVDQLLLSLHAQKVRTPSDKLVEALYLPADKRLLRRLVELCGQRDGVEITLTQEQLASLAGTSRATVNKVLREEQQRGSLKVERGRTTVLEHLALARRGR